MISRCDKQRQLKRPSSSRQGFVLVMVLILLTVAAISLSGLARRSLQLAADAADAQADFERRWQTSTLQQALLANVESLLANQPQHVPEDVQTWPLPSFVEGRIMAGEYQYHFLLADEDAKVNVNQILRQKPDAWMPVVMTLSQSANAGGLLPAVSPVSSRQGQNRATLQSWGQVFQSKQQDSSEASGPQIRDATRQLTCWGSGRLNVKRASDEAISALCNLVLSDRVVGQLIQERSTGDLTGIDDLISRLELKAEERFAFQRLLTDRSNCFTLWLNVSNGQREWTRLVVSQSSRGSADNLLSFTW